MNHTNLPTYLDDARVLWVTTSNADFGVACTEEGLDVRIAALAIAKYDNSDGVYLFACEANWQVVGDLAYGTVEEAKVDAERFYETGPLAWTCAET